MHNLLSLFAFLTIIGSSSTLAAQPIIAQSSGLASPQRIIDFGANLLPNFTPITTQIPGITIAHASYFTTGTSNNLVGGFLTNNFSAGPPETVSIRFHSLIRDLSFVYHQIGQSRPSVFRAMRAGNVVDTFTDLSNQSQPNNYFGFTNVVFDELQVDFVSDFNIDTLAINDAVASCTFRNGSNINPNAYSCTTRPVVGTTWQAQIATTANTLGTFVALAPGGAHPGFGFLGGEVLIQLAPAPLIVAVPASSGLAIPAAPSGIGFRLATQGIRVDQVLGVPTLVLLNALDLTFGL